MRQLPFPAGRFGVVVRADNALPHLLTEQDVRAAPAEASTPPQVHAAADGTGRRAAGRSGGTGSPDSPPRDSRTSSG
ncbi:hypothetical protein [Streptomyces sp. MUSC 14]|uniref:hypothetical protein n=1 Tax=Streptomyces sp. MUSC 14 TaxID=1354889 RepID=UPI00210E90FC|nr:hypothetical protein [Streptomyces sp. MUSC 14]